MAEIFHLKARAEKCRRAGYAIPVVANADEALELARRVAGELATASDREALLSLAVLQDVESVLVERLGRLASDMHATRAELEKIRGGIRASHQYGAAASLTVRRPRDGGA
jgi:hypothetical protein